MGLEFARLWALWLLPAALALVWWGWQAPARRMAGVFGAAPASRGRARSALYAAGPLNLRRRPTPLHTTAAAVRAVIFVLLVAALAGTSWRFTSWRQATAFVVDVSASVQGRQAQVAEFLRQAVAARGQDDQAAVVAVGETAVVDVPLGPGLPPGPVASDPGFQFTNLAEGLRLGGALLPEGVRRRVVLISDGHQNVGDAVAQARALNGRGIRVDVVPLEAAHGEDVMVVEVRVPPFAFTGEEVPVTAALRATVATSARVRLYAGKTPIAEQRADLLPGLNQVAFRVPAGDRGFQTYRVEVEAPRGADARPENDSGAGITRVSGTPAVLVVRTDPDDSAAIRAALAAMGVRVEEREPGSMPASPEDLRTYAAVVLANVPAHLLREQAMANLEAYVRDGGGLMMVGGEESFGLGGYHGTPVERALPVYMDIKGRGEIPSLGLVVVIDKSGSMGFLPRYGAPIKMELAKEAAIRTTDILSEQDLYGVVAFDARAGWVVDLGPVDDKAAIAGAIGRIYPGGGTNIYPGLELAFEGLRGALVKSKHIILLTDGVSAYGGNYERLTRQMREAGITLSTVAVGGDSDVFLLQQLARWGRGRFYYTEDGGNVPTIFAKETVLATRSYVVEQAFAPARASPSPLLKGLAGVPSLQGYVATRPKEAAEVALISPEQDPVLAHWQYGLGRAVAWTPDLKGRWARAWIGSPELQQLLANAVSWMMRPDDQGDVQVTARVGAGTTALTVEAPIEDGAPPPARARISEPDGGERDVELRAVAPGQYHADLPSRAPGAYLVQVEQQRKDGTTARSSAGFVVPYSPEYAVVGVNWQVLRQIAAAGGGQVLTAPAQAFAGNLAPVRGRVELWPWLLGLAALLWPLDVAVRRLVLRPMAVRAWLSALRARLRSGGAAGSAAAGHGLKARLAVRRAERRQVEAAAREPDATALRGSAPPQHRPSPASPPGSGEGLGQAVGDPEGRPARRSRPPLAAVRRPKSLR